MRHDDVQIRVTNLSLTAVIENLTVSVGGDKISWYTVSPDDSVGARLSPMGEPGTFMAFTLAKVKRYWHGPTLALDAGHAISIRIAADGTVTERHCTRPCPLPD